MSAEELVQTTIDQEILNKAVEVLAARGLTADDIIQRLLQRIVRDGVVPDFILSGRNGPPEARQD